MRLLNMLFALGVTSSPFKIGRFNRPVLFGFKELSYSVIHLLVSVLRLPAIIDILGLGIRSNNPS